MELDRIKSLLHDFMPVSRADALQRLYRKGWTVGATLAIALPMSSILNNAPNFPPAVAIVKASLGGAKGYTLPGHYDGLTAFENVDSTDIRLAEHEAQKIPPYRFDLFNRLAFEGENMFDVDEARIRPDLKQDFFTVRDGFCKRHETYVPQDPDVRFNRVCHPDLFMEPT